MVKREFRPERLPRRGELTAWALAIAVSLGMFILRQAWFIPFWAWIFWGFLLFSGLSISLGNWMDRRTCIRLDSQGVRFTNGLRRVDLGWSEIQEVKVLPSRFGKRVQVLGNDSHFEYKTIGEVMYQGELRGRTGFVDGQHILEVILRETELRLIEKVQEASYYARG
jgi:hypothetical protein